MALHLGGNIVLEGFDDLDFTEMIVVKKMVGQYARKLTDTVGESQLHITYEPQHTIIVTVQLPEEERTVTESASNLYVALDTALKKATKN